MSVKLPGHETLLELGLLSFGMTIAGALAVLAYGQANGHRTRSSRRAEPDPVPGQVPAERHQHIGSASPR